MSDKQEFSRLVRRTALMTVAFVAALVFGILLLADGDWVPGSIIVLAALVGIAAQIPVIRRRWKTSP
jgi:hydrogenase/urease accessory protein HupE